MIVASLLVIIGYWEYIAEQCTVREKNTNSSSSVRDVVCNYCTRYFSYYRNNILECDSCRRTVTWICEPAKPYCCRLAYLVYEVNLHHLARTCCIPFIK